MIPLALAAHLTMHLIFVVGTLDTGFTHITRGYQVRSLSDCVTAGEALAPDLSLRRGEHVSFECRRGRAVVIGGLSPFIAPTIPQPPTDLTGER